MNLWTRIAKAIGLPDELDPATKVRLVEAAGTTVDLDDHLYQPASRDQRRDLTPLEQRRMQDLAVHLWEANGLANRLIELPLAFLLAEGCKLQADDPEVQGWLNAFWTDPLTRLDERFLEHVRALKLFGELAWPVFTAAATGAIRISYIDPKSIDSVVKDPENPVVEIGIVVLTRSGRRKLYRTILDVEETELSPQAQRWRQGMTDGEVLYWRRNALPNSGRGRSDLLAQIDLADVHEQLLFGEAERADIIRSVSWDVELQGATDAEIQQKARTIQTPRPRSVRVRNEREKWTVLSPELKSEDASGALRMIRTHVLGGRSVPEHWFGDGANANRATAGEMGEPALKVLTEDQRQVKAMLARVGRLVVRRRLEALGFSQAEVATAMALPEYQVTAAMPDLANRDIAKFTTAFAQLVAAVGQASQAGLLTRRSAVEALALVAAHMGLDLDVEAELAAAEEEAAARAETDVFRLVGGVGGQDPDDPDEDMSGEPT